MKTKRNRKLSKIRKSTHYLERRIFLKMGHSLGPKMQKYKYITKCGHEFFSKILCDDRS